MVYKFGKIEPVIDETCFLAPGCAVIGEVKIGPRSSIWYNAVIRGDVAPVIIGESANIQESCTVHCTDGIETRIGNYVTVGHNAILHSCEIGDGSLIGMGAVVLDNAKIGKNCLIGAGTVVTPRTVIPDGSLVLGNPGRVKRELEAGEIKNMKDNADEYVRLSNEYLSGI